MPNYMNILLSKITIISCLCMICIGCNPVQSDMKIEETLYTISGSVKLLREDNSIEIIKNGVIINQVGTNNSTNSDSSGKWTLKNIPTGVYTLSFVKSGFSEFRYFNIVVDGNKSNDLSQITLAQIPQFTVNNIETFLTDDNTFVQINCSVSKYASQTRRVILFFDKLNESYINPQIYDFYSIDLTIPANENSGVLKIPIQRLILNGFSNGSKVYVAAYGISRFEATSEGSFVSQNPLNGKTIFWNYSSPAFVSSFLLPN